MKRLWQLPRAAALCGLAILIGCTDWPLGQDAEQGPTIRFDEEVTGELDGGEAVFRVMGERGRKVRVLLQGMSGQASDLLRLDVEGEITGYELASVTSPGDAPSLSGQASPWFIFPADVPYVVRVRGAAAGAGGPFRFRFQSPDHPVALGDTIRGEILRLPGESDVDEHRFQASAGQQIALILTVWEESSPVRVELYRGDELMETLGYAAFIDGVFYPAALRVDVEESGEYRVRIAGIEESWMLEPRTGAYQLEILEVDREPETASSDFALGTIINEAIDHPGDVDEFRLVASPGDEVNLVMLANPGGELRVPRPPQESAPRLQLLDPQGRTLSLAVRATPRFVVEAGGDYIVRVQEPEPWSTYSGSYSIAFQAIDRMPEQGDSVLIAGEWVSGAIEQVGDVDEFVFRATPGQTISVFGRRDVGVAAAIRLADGSTDGRQGCEVRYSCVSPLQVVPASGEYRLSVVGSDDELKTALGLGGYELLVNTIDPKPEMVDPVLAVQSSVLGESYYPAGDIDEYELLSPDYSAVLTLRFDGPAPLRLEILNAVTGELVGVDETGWPDALLSVAAGTRLILRVIARPNYLAFTVPSEPVGYRLDVSCSIQGTAGQSCQVAPSLVGQPPSSGH